MHSSVSKLGDAKISQNELCPKSAKIANFLAENYTRTYTFLKENTFRSISMQKYLVVKQTNFP